MNNNQNIPELLKGLYGVKPNQMRLHSGAYFDFEYCKFSEFHLYDLIHGVNNTARFGGQIKFKISVLDHLLHCDKIAKEFIEDYYEVSELRLCILVHDLHEGICCDVPAPLKSMLSDYKCIENAIQKEVLQFLGLDYNVYLSYKDQVKKIDQIALEREYLYGFHGINIGNTFPIDDSEFFGAVKRVYYKREINNIIQQIKKQ